MESPDMFMKILKATKGIHIKMKQQITFNELRPEDQVTFRSFFQREGNEPPVIEVRNGSRVMPFDEVAALTTRETLERKLEISYYGGRTDLRVNKESGELQVSSTVSKAGYGEPTDPRRKLIDTLVSYDTAVAFFSM